MSYVYRHIRLDTNMPFYIGVGTSKNYRRATEKARRNNHWSNIVSKVKYKVEILFDDLTWEEACEKEKEFIQLYGRIDKNNGTLCNHTDGGDGLHNPSQEIREKKRKSMLGKNKGFSNGMTRLENRLKVSNSRKGRFTGASHPKSVNVNCYNLKGDFLKSYTSIIEAQQDTGVPNPNIVKVCKGTRKSAGGYIWKYDN